MRINKQKSRGKNKLPLDDNNYAFHEVIKWIFFLFILIVFGAIIFTSYTHTTKGNSHQISKSCAKKEIVYPFHITGLKTSNHVDSKLINTISADELKINKRKFFIFRFNPITECTFNNVIIECYNNRLNPFKSIKESLLSNKVNSHEAMVADFGLVTRGVINDFILNVYKLNVPSITIKASKVIIDFKNNEAELINTNINQIASNKIITSKLVIWDSKLKVFKIPGKYSILSPKGEITEIGKGLILNFLDV